MKKLSLAVAFGITLIIGGGLSACNAPGQHTARHGGQHEGKHGGHVIPKQAGQAAFGALAEIVRILNRDANTDWSKVNIDELRRHLVDMNALTLYAQVRTEVNAQSIVHHVSGDGITLRAIQAMVPAHAKQLKQSFQWETATQNTDTGVILTLNTKDTQQLQRFKALGFFGVMATGSHHQMHHLQMARGQGHGHH